MGRPFWRPHHSVVLWPLRHNAARANIVAANELKPIKPLLIAEADARSPAHIMAQRSAGSAPLPPLGVAPAIREIEAAGLRGGRTLRAAVSLRSISDAN